jgi:hypothetical protein
MSTFFATVDVLLKSMERGVKHTPEIVKLLLPHL